MKLGTQQYLVYIIVLKCLEFKTIDIILKLRVKFRFYRFLSFFRIFSDKIDQTWFVSHETWQQNYIVYIIVLKWLE